MAATTSNPWKKSGAGVAGHDVVLERKNPFVDGVEDPARLREEVVFLFGARGDPVARADEDWRRVEVVEGKLADVGGDGLHYRTDVILEIPFVRA